MAEDIPAPDVSAEARQREALENMVWQFAYCGSCDNRLVLHTGGLSALEEAFDALGWPDPKSCPERECEAPDCHKEATTGTPTSDGYKRLCGDHFRELGLRGVAQRRAAALAAQEKPDAEG